MFQETCSHSRAHHLFLESLTTEFKAIHCGSLEEIQGGVCTGDDTIGIMGGNILKNTQKPTGIFYLETTGEKPYVIPDHLSFKHHNSTLDGYDILEYD